MPQLAERDLSTPDMMVGIYNWALVVDHQQQSAFIVGEEVEKHWEWLTNQKAEQVSKFKLTSD